MMNICCAYSHLALEILQGYLVHKISPPPKILQWAYAGPMVVLGGYIILSLDTVRRHFDGPSRSGDPHQSKPFVRS